MDRITKKRAIIWNPWSRSSVNKKVLKRKLLMGGIPINPKVLIERGIIDKDFPSEEKKDPLYFVFVCL